VNRRDAGVSKWRAAAATAAAFFVRWQLLWFALLAPLFLFPPMGKSWLVLILLLPLPWIISAASGEDPLPLTALNGPLGLLTLMVLVSLWATYDISFSASKVLGVVLGLAMFFAVVGVIEGRTRVRIALDVFVAAGTSLAVVGLLGTSWIGKVAGLQRITAHLPAVIRGVPGQSEGFQPNAIAGALVMFVPLQIALVLRRRQGPVLRVLHLLALGVTFGTVLLTQSRGGWIALVVGVGAWCLWESRRTRVALIIAVLVAAVMTAATWTRLHPLLVRAAGTGLRADTESRLELWSRAIYGIQDFPITGMGMNTFRRVMPLLYPAFLSSPDVDVAHAHNHLLQAALDLGLPGLIGYLSLWFLAGAMRRAADRDERRIAGGLAAGMIAYFVFGTADTIALGAKVGIFFWIALALIVALHRTSDEGAESA
jgi:putative inorganic carbon (HCO3(-)) transporter